MDGLGRCCAKRNVPDKEKHYMVSLIETVEWWFPYSRGWGERWDVGQVYELSFITKMSKFWGSNVQQGDCGFTLLCYIHEICFESRSHVFSPQNRKREIYEVVDTLINLIVVLTPQCARVSSCRAVRFKYIQLCQLYLSDAGEKAKICQGKSPNHDIYIHIYFFFFFFSILPQVACSISKKRLKKKKNNL